MSRFVLSAIVVFGLAGSAAAQIAASPTPQVAPTTAAAPTNTGASPAPAADADADIVTCRYEGETGTLFKKRICHTKKEWDRQTQDAHDTLQRLDGGAVQGQQSNAGGG